MTGAAPTRNVLIVAYYFPPLGLSGVQRTLKFAKYLPQYGWQPTVLTVDDRGYFAKDDSLLAELDGLGIEIVRTPSLDPLHLFRRRNVVRMPSGVTYSLLGKISQMLFIPDNKIAWKRRAVAAGREILAKKQFDVIYATAPPYTDFLIAAELKKHSHVPVVFDYRDAWLANPLHFYATPLHRLMHRRLEAAALRYADHVVTINRRIKELTLVNSPGISHNDITIIPQGYDAQDFTARPAHDAHRALRITYAGTFYYNRTPKHFFQALRALVDEKPAARGGIEVVIVGTAREQDRKLAAQLGISEMIRFTGYLPHASCIDELVSSDVLWVMIGSGPGDAMMSTGKLYEYLGARKTIFATVPEGEARMVLERSGAALVAPPEDVPAITAQLARLYDMHKNARLPVPPEQYVTQFDRSALTGQLARVFARVVRLGPHESRVVTAAVPSGR